MTGEQSRANGAERNATARLQAALARCEVLMEAHNAALAKAVADLDADLDRSQAVLDDTRP